MTTLVSRFISSDLISKAYKRLRRHQKYGEFANCDLDDYLEHLIRLGLTADDLIDHFSKPYAKEAPHG